jgi:hypothetical protein
MKTEQQLIGAAIVLLGLGGVFYVTQSSEKAEREQRSGAAAKAGYPQLTLNKEASGKLTKLEFTNGDKPAVVLEKKGDTWEITAPIQAKANQADVKSLLDSLEGLKVSESLDRTTSTYEQYEVNDGKGLHFVAYEGDAKKVDAVFGKSGSRGQTLRVLGQDGVWIAAGYQSGYFTKDAKGWRDKSILKVEEGSATEVAIENANGRYAFVREGDNWQGTFVANPNAPAEPEPKADDESAKDDEGKKGDKGKKEKKKEKKGDAQDRSSKGGWTKLDGKKVEDLLRAVKSLNAIDFADDKDDTGLDAASSSGGVLEIKLKDGDRKLLVGKKQKGANRFAKTPNDATVYVISSWAADWITAAPSKFEKADEKAGDKKDGDAPDIDLGGLDLGGE